MKSKTFTAFIAITLLLTGTAWLHGMVKAEREANANPCGPYARTLELDPEYTTEFGQGITFHLPKEPNDIFILENDGTQIYPEIDSQAADITFTATEPNLLFTTTDGWLIITNPKHDDHCPTQFGGNLTCVSKQGEVTVTCKNGVLEVTGDISTFINVAYDHFVHEQAFGEVHKKPVIFKELAVTE